MRKVGEVFKYVKEWRHVEGAMTQVHTTLSPASVEEAEELMCSITSFRSPDNFFRSSSMFSVSL